MKNYTLDFLNLGADIVTVDKNEPCRLQAREIQVEENPHQRTTAVIGKFSCGKCFNDTPLRELRDYPVSNISTGETATESLDMIRNAVIKAAGYTCP